MDMRGTDGRQTRTSRRMKGGAPGSMQNVGGQCEKQTWRLVVAVQTCDLAHQKSAFCHDRDMLCQRSIFERCIIH